MSLMLIKKRKLIEEKIEELRNSKKKLKTRSEELETEVDSIEDMESLEPLEKKVKEIEDESNSIDEDIEKLEKELSKIDEELGDEEERKENTKKEIRKKDEREMDNLVTRKGYEYLNQPEVRSFYENVRDVILKKREITNTNLTVPEVIVNRIESKIIGYSNLIGEVDFITLNGTGRVLFAGDIPDAIWTECCDPVEELADSFTQIELDCYKLGGYMGVCNATLEDSFVNLANFIEDRMAKAIAKSLDKSVINGDGVKKPIGVLVNATRATVTSVKELVAATAEVNSEDEIIMVASGTTLRGTIYPELLLTTSDGRYTTSRDSLLGFRFVRSDSVADGHIIIGDFKKYILAQRKGIQLARSTDAKFIEDQTLFKATGRYDGKPIKDDAFVDVTLSFA